jgi:hypothetical protein
MIPETSNEKEASSTYSSIPLPQVYVQHRLENPFEAGERAGENPER